MQNSQDGMQMSPHDYQQHNQQMDGGGGGDASHPGHSGHMRGGHSTVAGGRFDFEDGGLFCGGWEDNKAHGHGVCTGPKNQGCYSGAWHYGFEVSGVYMWPSGSSFEGQWQNGKRHGLGVETRGRWVYRGEWTQGFKGRYGIRQSATSTAKYEGTWANGLQDGYGSETYADGGTYQGQWLRGMRHGYGVRQSAPFGMASRFRPKHRGSMTSLRSNDGGGGPNTAPTPDPAEKRTHRIDDARGGFVLKARSDDPPPRRNSLVEKTKKGLLSGLKIRKQKSTGELEKKGVSSGSIRSAASTASWMSTESSLSGFTNKSHYTDSNASFIVEDEQLDGSVTETYMGEWKNDKRCGYGISERSDGLKYEGEWYANRKYGYGVTTFRDGTKEEGKYKNNVLITSQKKKHLFLIRSSKFRERIEAAVASAQRASKYGLQKADIAVSRTATARGKAEGADMSADHAREDSDTAVACAREFVPDFRPALLERFEKIRLRDRFRGNAEPDPIRQHYSKPSLLEATPEPTMNQLSQISVISEVHQQQTRRPSLQRQQPVNQQHLSPPIPTNYSSIDYSQPQFTQPQPPGGGPIYATPNKQSNLEQTNQNYGNHTQFGGDSIYNQQQQHQQQQSMYGYNGNMAAGGNAYQSGGGGGGPAQQAAMRRNSKPISESGRPMLGQISQSSSIDYFDHYKRPPSRDSSIDRYTRAASRLGGSRQPSVDRTGRMAREPSVSIDTPDRGVRAGSQIRGTTPAPMMTNINGTIPTGFGSRSGTPAAQYHAPSPQQPFEDVILRQRTLGQDIIPSMATPKRTESLYMGSVKAPPAPAPVKMGGGARGGGGGGGGGRGGGGIRHVPMNTTLQRKKSLPDVQQLPVAAPPMSREEVSALGSARREEVRRQRDESDRLRANPLLYLVSPQVQDWFSRQQLVLLVLVINILLALMFVKMLT